MILILFTDVYSSLNGFLTNQHNDHLPVGLLAQLIEHCIGIAEVMGSNPVQAWIFFRPYFHYCLVMFITAKIAFIYIHLLIRSLRIWFSYPQSFILRWQFPQTTSWKVCPLVESEIERVSAVNEWDFWYKPTSA